MSRVVQGENNATIRGFSSLHKGLDKGWKGGENDNILAHSDGKVIMVVTGKKRNVLATGNASYGNFVKIKHDNGYSTLYAHLSSVNVKVGQYVKQGQKIGYMGESGRTFGKHLHFEVRNTKDIRINPAPYLNADLPSLKVLTYQSYDLQKNKWLPNVKIGTNDYAGNKGHTMSAIYVDELEIQTHDMTKNKWLPWVKGRSDYAGNLNNPIDGVRIKNATYRVRLKGNKNFLPWVSKVDNTPNGYAGIYGKEIDAIQIK